VRGGEEFKSILRSLETESAGWVNFPMQRYCPLLQSRLLAGSIAWVTLGPSSTTTSSQVECDSLTPVPMKMQLIATCSSYSAYSDVDLFGANFTTSPNSSEVPSEIMNAIFPGFLTESVGYIAYSAVTGLPLGMTILNEFNVQTYSSGVNAVILESKVLKAPNDGSDLYAVVAFDHTDYTSVSTDVLLGNSSTGIPVMLHVDSTYVYGRIDRGLMLMRMMAHDDAPPTVEQFTLLQPNTSGVNSMSHFAMAVTPQS